MPTDPGSELQALRRALIELAAMPLERATAMPPEVYTSEALLELEKERIFGRQ